MSIFEAKEFWSTSISGEEEFDTNSIAIDNIDNDSSGKMKICVSSFKGILRIYDPSFNCQRESLLFEKSYDQPILQVACGNFIINSNDKQVAVLQSKRFFVVQFANQKNVITGKICYDHKLVRNGYNFCKGKIGEKNYDLIFVQSIDGVISIYEQDSLINNIAINEVIFPGPINYLPKRDAFLISNTNYELECYSYTSLATARQGKLMYQWVFNLGELIRDIKVLDTTIVILSETLLSNLDENGKCVFQKKLDYEPMALHCYSINSVNMYMISTTANHILVYKGHTLVWAVKVHDTPIFLSTSQFENVRGLITTLSEDGRLSVLYLGMEQVKNMKVLPSRPVDMADSEKLAQVIENYENGVVIIPKVTVTLAVDVNPNITNEGRFFQDSDINGPIAQVCLRLNLEGEGSVENIKVSIVTPFNIKCDDPTIVIPKLEAEEYKRLVNFRINSQLYPTYSNVSIYATYITDGTSQTTSLEFDLPILLFLRTGTEQKDAKHKITLCTNKTPVSLSKILEDIPESKTKPNIMGFAYPDNSEVTVIVSKSAGRYRIQSSQYEALLFIANQIANRLQEHFNYEVELFIEDEIYTGRLFELMDAQFKILRKRKDSMDEMEKYTNLYTVVQRNLLNKYKEKNPPALNNLDFLLKQVYKKITKMTEEIEAMNLELKRNSSELSITIEVVVYLVKLKSKMSEEHFKVLRNAFCLDCIDSPWIEVTYANMMNLFKYFYASDKTGMVEAKEMKDDKDLEKWRKYFLILIEKLVKSGGFK